MFLEVFSTDHAIIMSLFARHISKKKIKTHLLTWCEIRTDKRKAFKSLETGLFSVPMLWGQFFFFLGYFNKSYEALLMNILTR